MRERGKQFQGTKGPYIKKRILLAFVEQLGHNHEALIKNTIVESEEDNNPESDPSALVIASITTKRIRKTKTKRVITTSLLNARIEVIIIRVTALIFILSSRLRIRLTI